MYLFTSGCFYSSIFPNDFLKRSLSYPSYNNFFSFLLSHVSTFDFYFNFYFYTVVSTSAELYCYSLYRLSYVVFPLPFSPYYSYSSVFLIRTSMKAIRAQILTVCKLLAGLGGHWDFALGEKVLALCWEPLMSSWAGSYLSELVSVQRWESFHCFQKLKVEGREESVHWITIATGVVELGEERG